MHAHFGDPLVVDGGYFFRLAERKIGVTVEEGYRIYDLDNPAKVVDPSGREIGSARVLETRQTTIENLEKRDIKIVKGQGLKSKEEAIRIMSSRYSKKVRWITFVRFMPVSRLVNLAPLYRKEVKVGQ